MLADQENAENRRKRRLYISGISDTLSKEELESRLRMHTEVTDPVILNAKLRDVKGIFAHCTINATQSEWNKIRKLSGAVLKGSKLSIADAKPDWQSRRALDIARPEPLVPNKRKRCAKDTIMAMGSKQVKRGEIVKDSDVNARRRKTGWTKGRNGSVIAVLKRDAQPPIKPNPTAITRLWGVVQTPEESLVACFDDESDQWLDRSGRVIREHVIKKRMPKVETTAMGRVEVWGSDEEADTEIRSVSPEQIPLIVVDEVALDAELERERTLTMAILGDLLKVTEPAEVERAPQRIQRRQNRPTFKVVQRYDPNVLDSESDSEALDASDKELLEAPEYDIVIRPEANGECTNPRSIAIDRHVLFATMRSRMAAENASTDESISDSSSASSSGSSAASNEAQSRRPISDPSTREDGPEPIDEDSSASSSSSSDEEDSPGDASHSSDSDSDSSTSSDSDSDSDSVSASSEAASTSASGMDVDDPVVLTGAQAIATTPADLLDIFNPTNTGAGGFKLFGGDSDEEATLPENDGIIHPDRLAKTQTAAAHEYDENPGNSNQTVMTRDRGYLGKAKHAVTFPLLLTPGRQSIWSNQPEFLAETVDMEEVTKKWEENKPNATREWKNRKKEAERKLQQSKSRR